ncbi:MAG: glycosyltransferase family 4 protein [Candidatus Omnitrophota bacterium]
MDKPENRKRLRVLFFTLYGFGGASSRYRVYQYLPFLKEEGIDYAICPLYTDDFERISAVLKRCGSYLSRLFNRAYLCWGYLRRFFQILGAGRYDRVFIQKELMPAFLLGLLTCRNPDIIFDFDDAIYLSDEEQRKIFGRVMLKGTKGRIDRVLSRSRKVVVGNEVIGSYAKGFCPVVVKIPVAIDTHRYGYSRKERGEKIVLGWIGRERNISYLEELGGVFRKLLGLSLDFQLLVIGVDEKKINMDGVPVRSLDWSYQSEIEDLSNIDIGLMPLADDDWSRGKGGCKLLQYMALGIPTVSSPVGINADIIRDGMNGFLASTQDEWIDKIARLAGDRDLRDKMGKNARDTIENEYSLQKWARIFIHTLEEGGHAN